MMNEHDYCFVPQNQHGESEICGNFNNTNEEQRELTLARDCTDFSNVEVKVEKPDSPVECEYSSVGAASLISENTSRDDSNESCLKTKETKEEIDELDSIIEPVSNKLDFDEDIGEYYFETDHLALRGNPDYHLLLKTIAVLEAQRKKAIEDLDRLYEAQDEILMNPIEFVEKLQRKEDLNLPSPQTLATLPNIDWDKYLLSFNPNAIHHRHMTRKKPEQNKLIPDRPSSLTSESNQLGCINQSHNEIRSQTFNQPWTSEEQKRLEELLVKYPREGVESRRWEKIAQALGNRTRQQVASRVQKYFIKLTKAGLPVPGRTPNISNYMKKGYGHRHQRLNRLLFQPSTFFASFEPPVFMNDIDDDTMSSYNFSSNSSLDGEREKNEVLSDEETIPMELQDSAEYKELMMLQKLKKNREKNQISGVAQHVGFKCDRCECEPIMGTRWHCVECTGVDFCNDCVDCNHETETHKSNHHLQPIQSSVSSYVDGDYTRFLPGDYNYLDPNYMPAT